MFTNFVYLIKKFMMLGIVDKNVFKVMTFPNNLILIYRF